MIHKTTRSILSVLLAALLLVTSVPLTPAFAGGGGAVSPQSESGEGRALKPVNGEYQIYTADDLKEFAAIVNGTAEGIDQNTSANAKLMNDIVLNEKIEVDDNGAVTNQKELSEWIPIGSDSSRYRGTFNGDGHTISGLYIDSNDYYQGLFGYLSTDGDNTGTVQNLTVSGSVSGYLYVGGVVGYNGGNVINCTFSGSVSGVSSVGGVVGDNRGTVENCYNIGSVTGPDNVNSETIVNVGGVVGSNSFTVTNCYNTGSVTGPVSVNGKTTVNVGGVVGYNGGTVENCYNTGTVTGPDSVNGETIVNVGGVVGWNSSGTVENCYNTGTVTGPVSASGNNSVRVGGVVGYNSSSSIVTNCYNTGTVTVTGTDDYVGGVVGYNNAGGSVTGCYNTGSVSGTDDYVGGVVGYNGGTVTDCYFLTGTAGKGIGDEGDATGATVVDNLTDQKQFEGWDFTDIWRISQSLGFPVLQDNAQDGLPPGLGTEASPYEISTATQLKNFRDLVNDENGNPAAWAVLMENITLNSSEEWEPIGIISQQYSGTFDGNGHTISGLYIDSSGVDYKGLFGYVGSSGKVQNLSVSGDINGGWYVGGIAGQNNGSVKNCYNTGAVSGSGWYVGGVVGDNSGIVTNCYNTGSVSGYSNAVGGVVGWNDNGSVENCYNIGEVSGSGSGGIVGNNTGSAIVTNCYYQNDKASAGIGGSDSETDEAIAKDEAEFHSGEVAYLLQKEQLAESGQVWGQTLGGEEDSLPTLVALNPGAAQPVYKVTFKYGYDSAPADEISYSNGSVEFPAFERTGYTFAGWTPTGTTISQDTTFTAQWTANTYTVTLDPNDGTIAEDQNVTTYTYGIGATLPTTVTREGYTFAGWYEKEDLTGDPVTEIGKDAIGDKAYWAKWEEVENPEPEPTPTPTPTPDPTPSGPSTGDSTGWDDIRDELENTANGDEITIDMGDETKVPAEIFESLAGKDVDVIFDLGDIQWSVNGADIPTDTDFTDLDLGVNLDTSGIPVNVINTITGEVGTVQITLAHDGEFGFTMTLTAPLGKENAGYWANLYHYDESAEALNFEAAAKIDEDGSVTIPFSHASQYAIVIDTHSHAAVDVSDLFIDIAPDAWYKDAIQYAYDNGLMTGVSATEFAPEQTTTRAMIVSILARLEGVTTAQAAGFADVDDNDWYATAVNWAANVGVVNGYEDNTFQPNTAITREQLAAILMNYAAYKGEDVSNRASLDNYTDQPSTWAEETMSWAVAEGLITGVTNDQLQPQSSATRAQVAAILQRFLEA